MAHDPSTTRRAARRDRRQTVRCRLPRHGPLCLRGRGPGPLRDGAAIGG